MSLNSLISAFVLLLVCVGRSNAFTATPIFGVSKSRHARVTPRQLAKNDSSEFTTEAFKTFGVFSLGSILAFHAADASAESSNTFVPNDTGTESISILSSSTQLADEFKTMDMSLPSYGAISDAKNTQESLSTLVIEQPPAKNVKPSTKVAPKKGEPMKGPSISSFLPSLDKQGPKQKAEAAAKEAEKKAQKEAAAAEKRAEFERASAEKAAQRKEEALQREAAEAERKAKLAADKAEAQAKAEAQKLKAAEQKEIKTLDGSKVEVVDMSMPTYSGASDSRSSSPFALP